MVRSNLTLIVLFLTTCSAAPSNDDSAHIKVPEECKGKLLCPVKPPGYDEMEKAMAKLLPKYLAQDYSDRDAEPISTQPKLSDENDWDNCPYYTQTQSSYLFIYGKNETTFDILVQIENFKQSITTVECAHDKIPTSEGVPQCFKELELNELGIDTVCKTTKTKRALYKYDPKRNKIIRKWYTIPISCSCEMISKFKTI